MAISFYPAEVMCDGFNATNIYGNNYGAIHRSDADFTASNQNTIETWGQHYGSLKNFNIFINQIERFLQDYSSDANAVAKGNFMTDMLTSIVLMHISN